MTLKREYIGRALAFWLLSSLFGSLTGAIATMTIAFSPLGGALKFSNNVMLIFWCFGALMILRELFRSEAAIFRPRHVAIVRRSGFEEPWTHFVTVSICFFCAYYMLSVIASPIPIERKLIGLTALGLVCAAWCGMAQIVIVRWFKSKSEDWASQNLQEA